MQTTQNHCSGNSETLYVALELSRDSWKLAMTRGLGGSPRIREIPAGSEQKLLSEIRVARWRFQLPEDAAVVSCYEAGRDGFWVHRYLTALGWENHILDPASIEVCQRKRRVKTDRVDAERMVKALIRRLGGDQHACREVNVPSHEEEDARELHRELETLTREKTAHINRIKGLLFAQGIRVDVIRKSFPAMVQVIRTGDGRALLEGLRDRVVREFRRLQLVVEQIRELEQERAGLYRQAMREEGVFPRWQVLAVQLRQLSGIGDHVAMVLAAELFGWRRLKNRREVAALAGLTPSPWRSGQLEREQGIAKSGRGYLRRLLIEIAWGWIHFQPESTLTAWFMERFAAGNSRQRRIGIVAVARKLLVALWKFIRYDEVPEGARFTKNLNQFRYTSALT